jgi:hypothetical protein
VAYPGGNMLALQFLGGKGFDNWVGPLQKILVSFARDSGCMGIEGVARFGFWPYMRELGYDRSYAVYEMNV